MTTTAELLVSLIDRADMRYEHARQKFPEVEDILNRLKEAKAAGGFKRNDDWELKYSAIVLQMGLIDLNNLVERNQLTPHSAAGAWFAARFKFFKALGAIGLGEDAFNALGESFVPAESFWLALLESNYGSEFAESFKEARAELSTHLGGEDN